MTQPQAGQLCLSGTVATGGWAQIGLQYAVYNLDPIRIVKTFDADARGITQAAFTIDSPPSSGVTVTAAVTTNLECPASGFDCFTYGFELMTAPLSNIPLTITAPGPQNAPFANFEQTRSGVSQTFDTSALQYLFFGVGPGDYAFCLQDFSFSTPPARSQAVTGASAHPSSDWRRPARSNEPTSPSDDRDGRG